MQKEALYYDVEDEDIICLLCPHECRLSDGQVGICQTRRVYDGKLYSLSYGNVAAINCDPIEKKPLYHFLPGTSSLSVGTAGCVLRCKHCQNNNISSKSIAEVSTLEMQPSKVIAKAQELEVLSVSYTYNDPVAFYEYMQETASLAQSKGIKNVLVSSGYINKEPLRGILPLIDAANIDIKAFDDKVYKKLCKGKLAPVLDSLLMLKGAGVWLEMTNLIIPGWNDDDSMIHKMCSWLVENGFENAPLHFSRFFPMHQLTDVEATPIDTLHRAKKIAEEAGLKYIYIGNVRESQSNSTYCPHCGEMLVERQGYFVVKNSVKGGKCPSCEGKISGFFDVEE